MPGKRFHGDDGDNIIVGGADRQWIYGEGGDDQLFGRRGNDWLFGGEGHDTLHGGPGRDQLQGGAGSVLDGGSGDDHLNSGPGTTLNGGAGSDEAWVSLAGLGGVEVDLGHIGQGHRTMLPGDTVIDRVESIRLDLGDDVDVVHAGRARAYVNGGGGDDQMFSGRGQVGFLGEGGDDYLSGGANSDGLVGDSFYDAVGGADTLIGGSGPDRLEGGAGADRLEGDDGADLFEFGRARDSTPAAPDLIVDLTAEDTIELPLDADTTRGGLQTFRQVHEFTGKAGQLTVHFDASQNLTTIAGDLDGDGQADLLITASGDHADFTGFTQ